MLERKEREQIRSFDPARVKKRSIQARVISWKIVIISQSRCTLVCQLLFDKVSGKELSCQISVQQWILRCKIEFFLNVLVGAQLRSHKLGLNKLSYIMYNLQNVPYNLYKCRFSSPLAIISDSCCLRHQPIVFSIRGVGYVSKSVLSLPTSVQNPKAKKLNTPEKSKTRFHLNGKLTQ